MCNALHSGTAAGKEKVGSKISLLPPSQLGLLIFLQNPTTLKWNVKCHERKAWDASLYTVSVPYVRFILFILFASNRKIYSFTQAYLAVALECFT